jgi:hypothetical protein
MTAHPFVRRVLVSIACSFVVQDFPGSWRSPVAVDQHEREPLCESAARSSAPPASIPTGGYLKYRLPPAIEHQACRAPNAGEAVRGRLSRAVVLAAQEQLNLPMGYGRYVEVKGRTYLFCLEPHYHPPGSGVGPEGWHKGVTVYRGTPT